MTKETNKNEGDNNKKRKPSLKSGVFWGSAILIILLTAWTIIFPENSGYIIGIVQDFIVSQLGWYFILTTTIVIVFVIFVAISSKGKLRMGPADSKPEFSLFTWASMLFAAGIGIDVFFYSAAAPVSHYLIPPEGIGETPEAARQAVLWAIFHYGISGWALYALLGLALGLFAFRYNLPLSLRSLLYPIFGDRVQGKTGAAIEIAAILGAILGVATTLGIGVLQLNVGLNMMFNMPIGIGVQIGLVVLAVLITCISTFSGVDKGIRFLSELSIYVTIALLLFVVAFGSTQFLLNGLIQNIGDFTSRFPSMTLNTFAYGEADEWLGEWTIFFWAWWIAWAPFVGLFLARISRGRTIRQFISGTIIIPLLFIIIMFSIFGNSALELVFGGNTAFGETAVEDPAQGFYNLLEEFPFATLSIGVATFLGLIFYITSADSGALVMSNFSSNHRGTYGDGPPTLRIFWAIATGVLTLALLALGSGTIDVLQSANIIIGLPFSIILYLIMYSLYKVLKKDSL